MMNVGKEVALFYLVHFFTFFTSLLFTFKRLFTFKIIEL